jgi:ZIP family zinc transporter
VLEAALWALLAASALLVGAVVGIAIRLPRRLVSTVMAFGAGALISAVAFDLTDEAFQRGGTIVLGIGLASGATSFYLGKKLVERMGGRMHSPRTRRDSKTVVEGNGPAIVLGALLDGVPESVVLGATLLGGAGVGVPFLVAVFLSNLPEAVSGTTDLRAEGHRPGWIIGLWVAVVVASVAAAAIGYAVLGGMTGSPVAFIQAFAAGAILTMLADTMVPEAYQNAGDTAGLATVLGFALAYLLSTVS